MENPSPRKSRFAVLESSLLARKGQARPAIPPGNEHDEAVLRADIIAEMEAHHSADVQHKLGELIVRPLPGQASHPHDDGGPGAMDQPAAPDGDADEAAPPPRFELPPANEIRPPRATPRRREAVAVAPRGLDSEQASQYVGLSRTVFARLVAEGLLPDALPFGRRRVWDRRALDQALDGLSGIAEAGKQQPDEGGP